MLRKLWLRAKKLFFFLPGFLLWASFPPLCEKTDVFFALAPVMWFARNRTPSASFRLWFLNGLLFWVGTLSWMPAIVKNGGPWPLVVLGWFALAGYCALYFGAFGFLSARYWRGAARHGYAWRLAGLLFVEPVLWAGLELVRSLLFGGFAWNHLGVPAINAGLGAPAVLGGTYLVSACVVLVNGTLASVAERMAARECGVRRLLRILETVLPLALVWAAYASSRPCVDAAMRRAAEGGAPFRAALFQRNFPCVFSAANAEREDPATAYAALAASVAPFAPQVAVLPESAFAEIGPLDSARAQAFAESLANATGASAVIGGGTRREAGRLYNSAALFRTGRAASFYDKNHLVPFGEYIPFDKTFPALQALAPVGSCSPGSPATLPLPGGGAAGVAICYEDTDAAHVRTLTRMGATALVFITNDSWFSGSAEPMQHAWQAIARAIETGLPVLRVGNNGATGAIRPDGSARWLAGRDGRPAIDSRGAMAEYVAAPAPGAPHTPYVKLGDWPLATAFLLALLACMAVKTTPTGCPVDEAASAG